MLLMGKSTISMGHFQVRYVDITRGYPLPVVPWLPWLENPSENPPFQGDSAVFSRIPHLAGGDHQHVDATCLGVLSSADPKKGDTVTPVEMELSSCQ